MPARATVESFWARAMKKDGGCWEWDGYRDRKGYGIVRFQGRLYKAHRLAYELSGGQIPDGLQVMHGCDNPPCFNPEHLSVGTGAENCRDRVLRHRQRRRLSWQHIAVIRRLREWTTLSQTAIAMLFGVGPDHISRIVRGEVCRHVKG